MFTGVRAFDPWPYECQLGNPLVGMIDIGSCVRQPILRVFRMKCVTILPPVWIVQVMQIKQALLSQLLLSLSLSKTMRERERESWGKDDAICL